MHRHNDNEQSIFSTRHQRNEKSVAIISLPCWGKYAFVAVTIHHLSLIENFASYQKFLPRYTYVAACVLKRKEI